MAQVDVMGIELTIEMLLVIDDEVDCRVAGICVQLIVGHQFL